jgi:hypothetical protein
MARRQRALGFGKLIPHASVRLAAVVLTIGLAACTRTDPPAHAADGQLQAEVDGLNARLAKLEGHVEKLETASSAAPQPRRAMLTETWFVPGQAPSTTQTTYSSKAACENGRRKAMAEAQATQAKQEQADREATAAGWQIAAHAADTTLQASCSD